MSQLQDLLLIAIWAMTMAILGSVIISWLRMFGLRIPYSNALVRAIEGTADLMLRPIRNAVPTSGGGIDFSPMVAIIVLQILRMLVLRL